MRTAKKEQFEELKTRLQQDGNQCNCPIWAKSQAKTLRNGDFAEAKSFWSPRAGGVFEIPGGTPMPNPLVHDQESRVRISSWIWEKNSAFKTLQMNEEKEVPELTSALIKEIGNRRALSVERRIDRALRAIGRPTNQLDAKPNELTDIQALFVAATECGGLVEMRWLLRQLEQADLLTNPKDSDSRYYLSLKGLDRLETGGDALASNTAFVAMWFDSKVGDAYERGIAPAIRETGYEPIRIDKMEHFDRIDDMIVAEIRRARFLVCDFTCGLLSDNEANSMQSDVAVARGGVYYEAGLAHGLGKPVIWTCREDLLDHVHFDVRQYNFIMWEDGKEDELREALFNRIRAKIL